MDPSIVKRLAFIKYLFDLAIGQSQLPEPACSTSILIFHDAIELFNHLACEVHDIDAVGKGKRQPDFIDYWDLISDKIGTQLPQKESMKRLNLARVALKHHGNLPSKQSVESFKFSVNNFFIETSPQLFNIDFGEISLIDFISDENTRELLKEASTHLVAGDLKSAVNQTGVAFHFLLEDYENRKRLQYGASPFSFGPRFNYFDIHALNPSWDLGGSREDRNQAEYRRNIGAFVQAVAETINSMQNGIRLLAIGIDYPKYVKFTTLAPHVYTNLDGKYDISEHSDPVIGLTVDDAQFCIDFVVETALKLSEFDFTLPQSGL